MCPKYMDAPASCPPKSVDRETEVMMSWLLYIPAGLIEIHPHIKYDLATIIRFWDSTLAKNLNLVYGWMYVRTSAQPERSVPPAGRGCGVIKW